MSKSNQRDLTEILDEITPVLRVDDLQFFCTDQTLVQDFIAKHHHKETAPKEVKQFFIDNDEYIDKDKVILFLAKSYQNSLEILKKELKEIEDKSSGKKTTQAFSDIIARRMQIKEQEAILKKIIKLGKGIEQCIPFYYYDEKEHKHKVEVVDSRQVIDGKMINSSKKRKRFDAIDSKFKNDENEEHSGLEYALQLITLPDIRYMFSNKVIGDHIYGMILDNEVIGQKGNHTNSVEVIKDNIDTFNYQKLLTSIKNTLREYVEYLDIDNMLLICAYRYHDNLENGELSTDILPAVQEVLKEILANLSPNSQITCELKNKNHGSQKTKVKYSVEDLKQCMKQITANGYMTNKEVAEYRAKILDQQLTLLDIDLKAIPAIFSENELEKLSLLNEENLIYVSTRLNWGSEKIINALRSISTCSVESLTHWLNHHQLEYTQIISLYERDVLSKESLKLIQESIDLSPYVSFEKLDTYYQQWQEHKENEEFIKQYKKYVDLYKETKIVNKPKEEVESNSNQLMEYIIEKYDSNIEAYREAVQNYYQEGLLSLEAIVDWNDEELITTWYQEGIIQLQEIEKLVKGQKLSNEYFCQICEESIWNSDISQEHRVEILLTGSVSKETIQQLYNKTLIGVKDLEKLVESQIITEQEKDNIMDNLDVEKAEMSSDSKDYLIIDDSVQKIKPDRYINGPRNNNHDDISYLPLKDTIIIDPSIREKFFELLGAKKVASRISKDSPFYDYDFYMILGKDGKKHMNTPVIAERYYKDKYTEMEFATENATYFFQYGDFLVLRNYVKKDEVVSKKENVVFRSNHTIANKDRKGRWASSVIGNIVRTVLSSDLKEYNKENQKMIILEKIKQMYSIEQLKEIFALEEEIDSGDHLYVTVRETTQMDRNDEIGEK